MCCKNLKEINNIDELKNKILNLVTEFFPQIKPIIESINFLTFANNYFLYNKLYLFLKDVKKIEEDLEENVKLCNKLFENPENNKQNIMRLLNCIEKTDTEQKIKYYISATKSLLLSNLSVTDYFRIIRSIQDTLDEDLLFLKEKATSIGTFKGNIQIFSLVQTGLFMQAGINANEKIDMQDYAISPLGRMVDRYALSLEDEKRQKFYKKNIEQPQFLAELPTISGEEIEKMFNENN